MQVNKVLCWVGEVRKKHQMFSSLRLSGLKKLLRCKDYKHTYCLKRETRYNSPLMKRF